VARRFAFNEASEARLRPDGLPARLQDGAGGDRFEALGLALPVGALTGLLKFKNPEAPAVKREAEEDWGR
jgi:hypothetical protein